MKTLLTGFNRFGNLGSNPSQLVVEHFAARAQGSRWPGLMAEVLPTEFAGAGARITQLIGQARPDLIICLGVARGIPGLHLERVALNLDDTDSPDNAGHIRQGERICPDGPLAYESTLPIEKMRNELERHGIPVRVSNHAGTYVCNHVFYLARHEVERQQIRASCGFIHLPALPEMSSADIPGLPLELMIAAIELCLKSAQAALG